MNLKFTNLESKYEDIIENVDKSKINSEIIIKEKLDKISILNESDNITQFSWYKELENLQKVITKVYNDVR
jgi:hypothetical protein